MLWAGLPAQWVALIFGHIYGLLVAQSMIAWPSIRRGNGWDGGKVALKRHGLKHGKSIPKKGACRLCARVCRCSPAEPLYPRDSPPELRRQTSWASCVAGINYLYRSFQCPVCFVIMTAWPARIDPQSKVPIKRFIVDWPPKKRGKCSQDLVLHIHWLMSGLAGQFTILDGTFCLGGNKWSIVCLRSHWDFLRAQRNPTKMK